MAPTPTRDPNVFIEHQETGYIRYWRDTDNRRWEQRGTCRRLGECIFGAVFTNPASGQTITVQGRNDLNAYMRNPAWKAILDGNGIDTPNTPEFEGCCRAAGYLTYTELPSGPYQGD